MNLTVKTLINVAANATPVAAGAGGAMLGNMAGFGLKHWIVLAVVIVSSILAGALFVAGETGGRKFWSSVAVKIVMGFSAALVVGGSLKTLVPLLLGISVLSPSMLKKNALGGLSDDDDKGPGTG